MHQPTNAMVFLYRISFLLLFAMTSHGVVYNTEFPMDFNGSAHHLKTFEYEHSANHSNADCLSYQPHHEFILLQNGSLILPGSDRVHEFDSYYMANDTVFLCAEDDDKQKNKSLKYDLSEEFLICGHVLIYPDEFQLLPDGRVHIGVYGRDYGPRDFFLTDRGVYVCLPEYAEMKRNRSNELLDYIDKFSPSFTYVTYAGLSVSVLSLAAHLVLFCVVSAVRNLPGCCLASLSFSLLVAYACFLALALMDTSTGACANLGMCVYYFFLTSFFWMNVIAFDVWRSFRSVMRELRISSHRVPWRRFLLYSLYSWVIPGLLVVLVKVLDSEGAVPSDWRPGFGSGLCWFRSRLALCVFFALPLVVVMVLNAAFFLDVTCVISRAALKTSHEATLRKRFFMFMRLALIMGLTWIVGFVAAYANHVSLWYAFIGLNTLQGLFILTVFSCGSKVRGMLCCGSRDYGNSSRKRGSTSIRVSQISAQV